MNIEREYTSELNAVRQYIIDAMAQYNNNENSVNESIPADFKVLFILLRNVKVAGTSYIVTSDSHEEHLFYRAIENFKYSIQSFASNNVNIICEIREVSDEIVKEQTGSIWMSDFADVIEQLAPPGMYDSIIACSYLYPNNGIVGNTSHNIFSMARYCGYSHCGLRTGGDTAAVLAETHDINFPYLYTAGTMIHEFMHQLETYRKYLQIVYPYTHTYLSTWGPSGSSSNPLLLRENYSWNSNYFDDTETYPDVIERTKMSFYRAVLSAHVTYHPPGENAQTIGMFPLMWKICPRKLFLGRYLVQNGSTSAYYYLDEDTSSLEQSNTYENSRYYLWEIRFDFGSNNFKIVDSVTANTRTIPYTSTLILTRVGHFDDGGRYYFINETLNTTLGYALSGSSYVFTTVSIHSSSPKVFVLNHYSNDFYYISPETASNRFWDLTNNNNTENNTITLHSKTNYVRAQTWQAQFRNNTTYSIIPLRTNTRAVAYYDSNLRICTINGTNSQNWRPERVDNGKFIFAGNYRIRCSAGYIGYNGNTLIIVSSSSQATVWNIQPVGDNYYRISVTIGTTVMYFDVLNAVNTEGNTVQLYTITSHVDAQTWKFMLQNDGTVLIVPRLSLTRGIKNNTTSMLLSVNPTSWNLEKEVSGS